MRPRIVVGVLAFVLLCGCADEADPRSDQTVATTEAAGTPIDPRQALIEDEGATTEGRIKALGEEAMAGGRTTSAAALADGHLTDAERRQGYQDALDCMTEHGLEIVSFEEHEGLFGLFFDFIVGKGARIDAEASELSTQCEMQFTFDLILAWDIQSGERLTERAQEIVTTCLHREGVTGEVGETVDELREISPGEEVLMACFREVQPEGAISVG